MFTGQVGSHAASLQVSISVITVTYLVTLHLPQLHHDLLCVCVSQSVLLSLPPFILLPLVISLHYVTRCREDGIWKTSQLSLLSGEKVLANSLVSSGCGLFTLCIEVKPWQLVFLQDSKNDNPLPIILAICGSFLIAIIIVAVFFIVRRRR